MRHAVLIGAICTVGITACSDETGPNISGIDPLSVYGTLCVKCPIADPDLAPEPCVHRLVSELTIVQPKIVVVMGEDALAVLNDLDLPLARPVLEQPGEVVVIDEEFGLRITDLVDSHAGADAAAHDDGVGFTAG